MTEREFLIQEIDELRSRMEFLAHEAALLESGYRGISASNAELNPQIDGLDEWRDRTSDEIGRLHARLYEIEAAISRREFLADAAYGRSL